MKNGERNWRHTNNNHPDNLPLVSTCVISIAHFERIFDEFATFFFFFTLYSFYGSQYKVRIADTLLFRECSIKGPFLQIPFVPTIFLLFSLFPFFVGKWEQVVSYVYSTSLLMVTVNSVLYKGTLFLFISSIIVLFFHY